MIVSIAISLQFISEYIGNRIFINRLEFNIRIILMIFGACVLSILSYEILGVYANIVMISLNVAFNYKDLGKWLPSLGIASLIATINIIADHIASLFENYFNLFVLLSVDYSIVYKIFGAAIIALIITVYSKKIYLHYLPWKFDSNEGYIVFSFFIFTYVVYLLCIFLGVSLGNTPELIQLNLLFFVIYLAFLLVAFGFYSNSIKKEFRLKQKETEYQAIQQYTTDLGRQYNHMRKFRHDYLNILSSLDSYIDDGDLQGLTEYYKKTIRPSSKFIETNHFKLADLSNIHVREIKSIIASKLMYAQELGIDASLEVREVIEEVSLDSLTLIRILGIFLDNAIEEVEQLGKGTVRVAVIPYEQSVQIIIENTCREQIEELHQLKKSGFSTKGEQRGLGLNNVDELLKEAVKNGANVMVETFIENNRFTQILNIPK